MPRHTPGPPRGPQPGSPARPALPGPCPWRGPSRGARASCPRSLGPLPPSPPGHGQHRAGGMLPVPLAGTPGMEPGAGGWKAPGERGPWGARPLGGSWRERVANALMREPWASRGCSPGRLNPLPRAGPLFLPLGGSSPQRGVWPPRRRSASYPHASASVCLSVPPRSLCLSIPLSPLTVPWGKAGGHVGPLLPSWGPRGCGVQAAALASSLANGRLG